MANQEEWAGQVAASEGKAHIRDCAQHVISKHAHDESESCKADVDVACGNRGARTYSVGACGKTLGGDATQRPPQRRSAAVQCRGVGRAPLHSRVRSSVVRVVFSSSAAANSLAPLSPILLPAARGAHPP